MVDLPLSCVISKQLVYVGQYVSVLWFVEPAISSCGCVLWFYAGFARSE
jgi:hypothetical protein